MAPFLHAIQLVEDLLGAEEIAEPVQNLTDLASQRARRFALEQALANLEASVARLRDRWRNLTPLPDEERIRWAQAVLQLPNLAFLELDTDGLSTDADLIRVVLLAKDGSKVYTHTISPSLPLPDNI